MVFQSDKGIAKARKHVEAAIRGLGMDPDANRMKAAEGAAAWSMARGSAMLMIALNPGVGSAPARLRLVSPIVKIPDTPSPDLFRRLLELNGTELPGVSFGIIGDEVVLVAERGVQGLDRGEVDELLAALGHFADEYDDLLVKQFGGTRVCDLS